MRKSLYLDLELKDGKFQMEVIIAALITMIIYAIQLFLSVKNFRKRMDKWYDEASKDPQLAKQYEKREIIRKSTQYPSYLLLYLLGGFFLCFHLILFFCLMISQMQWKRIGLSQGRVGYILPILVVYFLQKMVIRWLHFLFDCLDKRKESNLNLQLNILDSVLLYLKLISCKIHLFERIANSSVVNRCIHWDYCIDDSIDFQCISEYNLYAANRLQLLG